MYSIIKKLFFGNTKVKTFFVTRLSDSKVEESVFLRVGEQEVDITRKQGMICLDPFCIAVWLSNDQFDLGKLQNVSIGFKKKKTLNARLDVSLIEAVTEDKCVLLLYKVEGVRNYQLNPFHRLILLAYLLKNTKSNYYDRKVISALYSYPRKVIIVSYKDDQYYNIFPMDIQGDLAEHGMYILGLRTTNVALEKIIQAKKVIICDSGSVDLETVYELGKHPSAAPPAIAELPFKTSESEVFKFPVPDFSSSYYEVEIFFHRKMGYHMLLVGKVINREQPDIDPKSLYHVGFLQFRNGNYSSIDGVY